MHCAWCHNPETIAFQPETIVNPDKCIHCGKCNEGCFSGARRTVGREMTPEQVIDEVLLDSAYYGEEGGMTLTGGEPTCQPDFTEALLALAERSGISCAMESNLNTKSETLKQFLRYCNLLMCDMKIWDDASHRFWTGVSNALIKKNLLIANETNIPIIVRTPLISGINADPMQIGAIAEYLSSIDNLLYYELLPYHELGLSKKLEGSQAQQRFSKPEKAQINQLASIAKSKGIRVFIAGVEFKGE